MALNRLSGKQTLHGGASHDKPVYHAIPGNETSGTVPAFSTAEEEMKQHIQNVRTEESQRRGVMLVATHSSRLLFAILRNTSTARVGRG